MLNIIRKASKIPISFRLVSEMNGWWSNAEAFGKAIVAGEVNHDNAQDKLTNFIANVNAGGSLE